MLALICIALYIGPLRRSVQVLIAVQLHVSRAINILTSASTEHDAMPASS